jgi:glutamate racemase
MSVTDKKIGVFDSGHGGLSLVRSIAETGAHLQIDYFADLEYHPYGALSDEVVFERAVLITEKLIERGAELILVACNTATAVAIDLLREKFNVPFVGIEPYLSVFERQAIPKEDAYVLMTPLMAASKRFGKLKDRRDPEGIIKTFVCPRLASLVEEGLRNGQSIGLQKKIQNELGELKSLKPQSLILGCTHYPFLKEMIEQWTGAQCYSPCPYVAQRVLQVLEIFPADNAQAQGQFSYSLDLTETFKLKDISDYRAFRIL